MEVRVSPGAGTSTLPLPSPVAVGWKVHVRKRPEGSGTAACRLIVLV